jgi:hypothetical protein
MARALRSTLDRLFGFKGRDNVLAAAVALRRPHRQWNNGKQRAGSLTPA